MIPRSLLIFGASLASTVFAYATELFIVNPGFEDPVTPAATFSGTNNAAPPGWSISDASSGLQDYRYYGVWNPEGTNSYINGAPEGDNVGVVFLINNFNSTPGGLQQTLGDTLQLSTEYRLTVQVGNFAPSGSEFNFAGFPGYRVELLAGGVVIASDNNTLSIGEGVFATSTVTYTSGTTDARAGQALGIRLMNLNFSSTSPNNASGIEVNFDDVHLISTAVPEPSALALVGLAGLTVWGLRRRR